MCNCNQDLPGTMPDTDYVTDYAGPDMRPVPPPTRPAQGRGYFPLLSFAFISRTAKGFGLLGDRDEETRPLAGQRLKDAFQLARINPTALPPRVTRAKLAAKGYIDPAAYVSGRGVRGMPIVTEDVEIKP